MDKQLRFHTNLFLHDVLDGNIVSNTRQYYIKAYKSIEYIGFEWHEPAVLKTNSNEGNREGALCYGKC